MPEKKATVDDVVGWLTRNPFYEPTHDEAMVLVDEIRYLQADADERLDN